MLAVLSFKKLGIALLCEESVSKATKINPSHLHYWLKLNCVYHWVLCRNLSRVVHILLLSTPKNYQFLGNQNPMLYLSQVSPVCPTRYRTRHFFSNSKFQQEYVCCVRNEEECVCSVCL